MLKEIILTFITISLVITVIAFLLSLLSGWIATFFLILVGVPGFFMIFTLPFILVIFLISFFHVKGRHQLSNLQAPQQVPPFLLDFIGLIIGVSIGFLIWLFYLPFWSKFTTNKSGFMELLPYFLVVLYLLIYAAIGSQLARTLYFAHNQNKLHLGGIVALILFLLITFGPYILRDITPPYVSITNPTNGSTVSDTVDITISASDDVAKVEFLINGYIQCVLYTRPYSCSWKVPDKEGVYTISVTAYDHPSNRSTDTISVTAQ